jgi:hypothetical protein
MSVLAPTLRRGRVSDVVSNVYAKPAHAVCPGRQLARSHRGQASPSKPKKNEVRARLAKTAPDREYYERMSRKWLGITDAWRVIADVRPASGAPACRNLV